SAIIRDFDTDRDGKFSPAELAKLKAGAFDNLKNFAYFTHFRVNGKMEDPANVQDFEAFIDKGKLIYRFVIRPQTFAAPNKTSLALLFYDEAYYVDLRIAEGTPIGVSGATGCGADLDKNPDLPDYGGMFLPERVHVHCS